MLRAAALLPLLGLAAGGEVLYNGIELPAAWPPRLNYSRKIHDPPYLSRPPPVINATLGRQLFVDSFLISELSGAELLYHQGTPHAANPVIRATEPWENGEAKPFSGGAWYWQGRCHFWYSCGCGYHGGKKQWPPPPCARTLCHAESTDGIHWTKPVHANGTNEIRCDWSVGGGGGGSTPVPRLGRCPTFDGADVHLDYEEPDPAKRWKMNQVRKIAGYDHYTLLYSADGLDWRTAVNKSEGLCSDRSTLIQNRTA